jgi:hypothetical protein
MDSYKYIGVWGGTEIGVPRTRRVVESTLGLISRLNGGSLHRTREWLPRHTICALFTVHYVLFRAPFKIVCDTPDLM